MNALSLSLFNSQTIMALWLYNIRIKLHTNIERSFQIQNTNIN